MLHIITIGKKCPTWIKQGYIEYVDRLPKDFKINLIEINSANIKKFKKREAFLEEEAKRCLPYIEKKGILVILDVKGNLWDTTKLAEKIQSWQKEYKSIQFLIGGFYGVANSLLKKADAIWSVSPATFPHSLMRIILAEQIYRAWCILNNHPYHQK